MTDPKVDIPSNKAIFKNVIKDKKNEDDDEISEEDENKLVNEDEIFEKELQAIKNKISRKISKVKDVN